MTLFSWKKNKKHLDYIKRIYQHCFGSSYFGAFNGQKVSKEFRNKKGLKISLEIKKSKRVFECVFHRGRQKCLTLS
jgi:hypothetical protein